MADWVINGKFTAERMQGVVRYACELVKALDEVIERDDFAELVVPPDARNVPDLKRIRIVKCGKRSGIAWEQFDFARYMRRHRRSRALNLCNVAPLFVQPGVTTVHDVMYKVNPSHYRTARNRLSRLWHILQYAYITRHELAVLTVSEFSKEEIERHYPKAAGRVYVVPNGWQHVLEFERADDWQSRYPFLVPGDYYFSMATLARNKNGKWVMEVARRNPSSIFAIAGGYYETEKVDVPPNVHLLGFVTDADACSLIENCKAFLFPSLYEGFGIPPLEALALGAEVISSNTTSLPEVLGRSAHYVDPFDYEVDLDALLTEQVAAREESLERFSWGDSSKDICSLLLGLGVCAADDDTRVAI